METSTKSEILRLKERTQTLEGFKFSELPTQAGIYSFWWTGDFEILRNANTKVTLIGKKIKGKQEKIEHEWQISDNGSAICLYIGKTTNIKQRIAKHLYITKDWKDWYTLPKQNNKEIGNLLAKKNAIYKPNTVCQFRAGLQHLLKNNEEIKTVEDTFKYIDISFIEILDVGERFYLENLAIGSYRPLFNIDSER